MKIKLLSLLVLVLVSVPVFAAEIPMESDLLRLNALIEKRDFYEQQKQIRISSIMQSVPYTEDLFGLYLDLYDEYKSYNYDTAMICVDNLDRLSVVSGLSEHRYEALLARGFVYLSGGLFKEAVDVMNQIEQEQLPCDYRYYITYARLVWDMANYTGNELAVKYSQHGIELMHLAADMVKDKDMSLYWYAMGSIDMKEGLFRRGIERFLMALEGESCTAHDSAVIFSSIAYQYRVLGEKERSFHYYVEASGCDIRSCTKEAIAMRYAALTLYEEGRLDDAERYIRLAQEDALRYNARHRQIEISQILPIIEEHQLSQLRRDKQMETALGGIAMLLLCVVIGALLLLMRRTRAIHQAQNTIAQINENLLVANHVKENLLGNLLAGQSQYLGEVERYQQSVKRNAAEHRFAELQIIPRQVDAQRRRQVFFRQLDELLLDIYPSFVEDFNALLRPEEQMVLKPGEKLNAEMRIFALIRLGFTHNEAIAQVMDYSVNTIYAYKTRIKNRSNLSADEFLAAVMRIPSFRK